MDKRRRLLQQAKNIHELREMLGMWRYGDRTL